MNSAIAKWLLSDDVGMSSLAILAFMEGAVDTKFPHPLDFDDLGRCIRLLNLAPEYRSRLHEMKVASPQWKILIEHWDAIEALYFLEVSTGYASICYTRMRDLLNSVSLK